MKRIVLAAMACACLYLNCAAQQKIKLLSGPAIDSVGIKTPLLPANSFSALMDISLLQPGPAGKSAVSVIPASFYADHLGFFCKKELQIQSLTGLPLKFRLGSVEYTDHLEGKDR